MNGPTQLASDPVTLDDLKRAVESVRPQPAIEMAEEDWCRGWAVHHATRAAAWKTAFFWFHHHMARPDEGKEKDVQYFAEYDEGIKLLREKLL